MPGASRRRPSIAVVGAGSIGCQIGARLSEWADITLIGRERVISAIRSHGITLTGGSGSPTRVSAASLRLSIDPSDVTDASIVLITTKSRDTRDAAQSVASHVRGDGAVISLQNGLRNTDVIRHELADSSCVILTGTVGYNVAHVPPATFHQGTAGEILVENHPAAATFVRTAERAGLAVRTRDDMREVQAAKLLLNLNNAINALSGLPLRAELLDRSFRRCAALCQYEALAVFQAEGIRPARLTPLPPTLMPVVLRAPTAVFRLVAAQTLKVDAKARSSMADDFERGKETEIGELQGEVIDLGVQHGVATPACARVAEIVRSGTETGPWTGDDLLAELTDA